MIDWKVLDTGVATAEQNMARDAELLVQLANSSLPILHLYDWDGPSATYGHFIQPEKVLSKKGIQKHQLNLAKRPTGGGVLFHTCDFAFSVLVPASHPGYSLNTLENYVFVNHRVAKAIHRFLGIVPNLLSENPKSSHEKIKHFCMAKPTVYDVMLEGRKVGGAAQRKTKHGFLHQGSVSLTIPNRELLEDVLEDESIVQAMQEQSFLLLGADAGDKELEKARQALRQLLIEEVTQNSSSL